MTPSMPATSTKPNVSPTAQLGRYTAPTPSISELTEQLSESRVGHAADKPMDELASALGDKWAPNTTYWTREDAPVLAPVPLWQRRVEEMNKRKEGEETRVGEVQSRGGKGV